MTDTSTEAVSALAAAIRAYRQADEEGIMVLVSRQACDEVADTLLTLCGERDALQAKLDEAEANINLKADFIEATLNDCADLTQQLDEAQAGRVKVRELRWDKHPDEDAFYGGGQDNLVGVNEYNIFPHPCAVGLFVLDVMGNRTEDDFTSVEAAKAAAQADYERRILAAIDMQPLTDQQAARRLLESIPSPLFGELKQYLIGEFHVDYVSLDENGDEVNCVIGVPWTEVKAIIRAALTAIAEAIAQEGNQ